MSIANPHLEKNLQHRSSVSPEAAKLRRRATMLTVCSISTIFLRLRLY